MATSKSSPKEPSVASRISNFFSNVFKFRKTSLTLFTVLTYVVIVALDFYAEHSALQVPQPEPFYLASAWYDLQKITEKPHPYTSYAYDNVYQYIYNRANEYSKRNPNLIQVDSTYGNSSIFKENYLFNSSSVDTRVSYFEATNVYAKIEGTNPELSTILVSSHYDSVPTAYGAVDAGQGITTMLGILDYYSKNNIRPLRTMIFNFDGYEEYGSFGASVFFNHPWSKQVEHFINLEGTGAGGRAILFRSTNYGLAKYYKYVPSPFASSIFQEGFNNRFINSETDYSEYIKHGLKGFDIAFYKPRSLYHTYRDSIASTSKGSLHHMLSNTLALVEKLSDEAVIDQDDSQAVYFDILGKVLIIFSINTLYTLNITLLVIIPVIIILFLIVIFRKNTWRITHSKLSAITRLPISLIISGLVTSWVSQFIQHKNPMVVSLNYNIVLVVLTATSLLVNYIALNFFNSVLKIHDQKLVVLLELDFLLYVLTLVTTVREKPPSSNTGEWITTVLYLLFSVSTIFGLLELSVERKKLPVIKVHDYGTIERESEQDHDEEADIEDGPDTQGESGHEDHEGEASVSGTDHNENDGSSSESSPLLERSDHSADYQKLSTKLKKAAVDSLNYDWSIQYILLVPAGLYFVYFNVHELLQALYQNSQYGNNYINQLFSFLQLFALGLSIPVLAFVHKINYVLRMALLLIIIVGTLTATWVFPFTYQNPLKVSFYQEIDLDHGAKPIVKISGTESFLKGYLQELPSVKSSKTKVSCTPNEKTAGLEICSYEGPGPNLVSNATGATKYRDLLSYKILKNTNDNSGDGKKSPYEPYEAELLISVKENRHCTLTFNTTKYASFKYGKSPLRSLTVYHDNNTFDNYSRPVYSGVNFSTLPSGYSKDKFGNEHFKWFKGIDQIQLHKINFTQDHYHIGLLWIPRWFDDEDYDGIVDDEDDNNKNLSKLGIQMDCFWAEYDENVKVGNEIVRKIPAYDELTQYSPEYMIYTKSYPGLVIVKKSLEL